MARQSTRDVILDTAERLFAERGMDVSLRTINTEAGFSVAALHYHFRTRERLIDALIERRQTTILASRKTFLDRLEPMGKPDIHSIVEALVLPLAEPVFEDPERGLYTIKFLFRTYVDQANYERSQTITKESYRIFDRLLERSLPHIDPELLHQRWEIAAELTFQGLASYFSKQADSVVTAVQTKGSAPDYRKYVSRLIDFIAGGLGAEASSEKISS